MLLAQPGPPAYSESPVGSFDVERGEYRGLREGIILTQRTSQCCRCCCLQPNIDWDVFDDNRQPAQSLQVNLQTVGSSYDQLAEQQGHIYTMKEDATFCGRTCSHCYPGWRQTSYSVFPNKEGTGEPVATHSKPTTCGASFLCIYGDSGPVRCPVCCCLPYITTKNADGNVIGSTEYICDECLFVPKFAVKNATGLVDYVIRTDTCFFGCCMKCKCDGRGAKCCRIPFYIREPYTNTKLGEDIALTDLWAGWKRECCTRKDLYSLKFPVQASQDQKMTLLGAALLLDMIMFEQEE